MAEKEQERSTVTTNPEDIPEPLECPTETTDSEVNSSSAAGSSRTASGSASPTPSAFNPAACSASTAVVEDELELSNPPSTTTSNTSICSDKAIAFVGVHESESEDDRKGASNVGGVSASLPMKSSPSHIQRVILFTLPHSCVLHPAYRIYSNAYSPYALILYSSPNQLQLPTGRRFRDRTGRERAKAVDIERHYHQRADRDFKERERSIYSRRHQFLLQNPYSAAQPHIHSPDATQASAALTPATTTPAATSPSASASTTQSWFAQQHQHPQAQQIPTKSAVNTSQSTNQFSNTESKGGHASSTHSIAATQPASTQSDGSSSMLNIRSSGSSVRGTYTDRMSHAGGVGAHRRRHQQQQQMHLHALVSGGGNSSSSNILNMDSASLLMEQPGMASFVHPSPLGSGWTGASSPVNPTPMHPLRPPALSSAAASASSLPATLPTLPLPKSLLEFCSASSNMSFEGFPHRIQTQQQQQQHQQHQSVGTITPGSSALFSPGLQFSHGFSGHAQVSNKPGQNPNLQPVQQADEQTRQWHTQTHSHAYTQHNRPHPRQQVYQHSQHQQQQQQQQRQQTVSSQLEGVMSVPSAASIEPFLLPLPNSVVDASAAVNSNPILFPLSSFQAAAHLNPSANVAPTTPAAATQSSSTNIYFTPQPVRSPDVHFNLPFATQP